MSHDPPRRRSPARARPTGGRALLAATTMAFPCVMAACSSAPSRRPAIASAVVATPTGGLTNEPPAPCPLPASVADARGARCLTVHVPEDRRRPTGRSVPLRVVVIGATTPDSVPDPIFYFSGGPGQAATDGIGGITSETAGTRTRRALVLIDQRGTGGSQPLHCELGDTERALVGWLTGAFDRGALRRCRATLVASGVDLARYATADAVEDVEAVRRALGYERINLFGISYGTRVAVEYLRRYPERTRTATLRGLHAPDSRFPLGVARDAQRALDLTLVACTQDPACRTAVPAVRDDVTVAFARARTRPARLPLGSGTAGTPARADSITITPDVLAGTLLFALYSTQGAAAVPSAARAAARGDVAQWAAPSLLFAFGASRTLALGMYLSVVCAEDVPRITRRDADSASRGTFLGDVLVRNLRDACDVWLPDAVAPDAPPIRSDVPVLILAGDADPVTPPRWGEALLRGMPRGRQVVLTATGHVPSMPPCASAIFARFVEAGATDVVDATCAAASSRPPFATEMPTTARAPSGHVAADVAGTWDLFWTKANGTSQSGFLVIRQRGTALTAEVHGDGTLEAKGTVSGDTVVLEGRRIASFAIRAVARGDTLAGSLKVLTVERHFTAARRK